MTTYSELCRRAKKMGHKLTPELQAELKMLAAIPDEDFLTVQRKAFVEAMAREFQVTTLLMAQRLEGIGPYLPKGGDQ